MDALPDAPTAEPVTTDEATMDNGPREGQPIEDPLEDPVATLHAAVRRGDLALCRSLLDRDPALAATPSSRGGSLFLEAFEREHGDIAAVFEGHLAKGSQSMVGMSVHEAASMGRPAALRHALTEDMLRVEEVGPAGFAPLHRASYRGQPEAVKLLLEVGADPAQRAANGAALTPLHSAVAGAQRFGASDGHQQVVELLLAAGADPDATMEGGWTPRATAADAGLELPRSAGQGEGQGEDQPADQA